MNLLVAGHDRQVFFLCRTLVAKGHTVTLVVPSAAEGKDLAQSLPVQVILGDATESYVLQEAGAAHTDVLVAMTGRDQENFVVSLQGKVAFHIPRVVAQVHDPDLEEAYTRLGIPTFSTNRVMAGMVSQTAIHEEITQMLPMGSGNVLVTEIDLTKDSPAVGKRLMDVGLPQAALIAAIVRADTPQVPNGQSTLTSGDRIVLFTLPESFAPAMRLLTGENP